MRKKLHRCLLFLLALYCTDAKAQTFRNMALIDSVQQAGFYRIIITSELSSLLKIDFSDLRIADAKDNPVPYVVRSKMQEEKLDSLVELKIVENTINDSGKNILIVENGQHELTGMLYLQDK